MREEWGGGGLSKSETHKMELYNETAVLLRTRPRKVHLVMQGGALAVIINMGKQNQQSVTLPLHVERILVDMIAETDQ